VAGFFDYQWIELNPCPGGPPCEGNGIFNETVYYGGSLPSGLSVEANDSFAGTVYTNFQAFNFVTGFYNSILLSPPYDAAVGMGYQFSLGAGDPARRITFTVSLANPGGFYLYQGDANAQEQIQPPYVYFSATSGDAGEPVIPEPGTMLLLGSGLIACARRLRRR
jgi:PEP-CTERM motif